MERGLLAPRARKRNTLYHFRNGPHSAKSMFHKTDTLDYVVCLEGEMIHHMDKGFVTLKPGDVLIQRGTNHCWENRGDVPARLVIVLVDGNRNGLVRSAARRMLDSIM